jgi:dTDP-4-dehydrorhamnose 3,5-epimerase
MIFTATPLKGSFEITLTPTVDNRGWFARFYCKEDFAAIGHKKEWVQMNHSYTKERGTLRGMHYQKPPFSEIKLVRCISGAIQDVIIDLRKESDTFLKSFSTVLSAEKKNMVYIPEGFAHGFQTLTKDCELIYMHSSRYAPAGEAGVRFDDPLFNIEWSLPIIELSDRDKKHSYLDHNFNGI